MRPKPRALDAAGELGALGRQLCDGLLDVVAHKRDLMMCRPAIGRVDAKLRRARSEDEPALVRIDVRPAQHVAEEGPRRVGVVRMDQRVETRNHRSDSRWMPGRAHAGTWALRSRRSGRRQPPSRCRGSPPGAPPCPKVGDQEHGRPPTGTRGLVGPQELAPGNVRKPCEERPRIPTWRPPRPVPGIRLERSCVAG